MSRLCNYIHIVPEAPKCHRKWASLSLLMLLPPNLFLCAFSMVVNGTIFHPVTQTKILRVPFVIVKFMCQLDGAAGYKVVWLNIISGCFYEGVFPEEISFWVGVDLSKVDGSPQRGWSPSCPLKAWILQKVEEGWVYAVPGYLSGTLTDLLLPSSLLVLRLWDSDWNPYTPALWFSGLSTTPLTFLSLQFIDSLQNHVSLYLLITLFLYISLYL